MSKPKPDEQPALERRFYGIHDAAYYMGVSVQFLYNRTSKKSKKPCPVPFRRLGGKILFDIQELRKL